MTPLARSTNLAARMGRWSARHKNRTALPLTGPSGRRVAALGLARAGVRASGRGSERWALRGRGA